MKKYFSVFLPAFFLGAYFCHLLIAYVDFSTVLASSVVGLSGTFIFQKKKNIQALLYSGSFVGMSDLSILGTWFDFLMASLIGSLLFYYTVNRLNGFGGKLGTLAFMSVATIIALKGLL